MNNFLKIAIIQPSANNIVAWNKYNPLFPRMDIFEAARIWRQIHIALSQYINIDVSSRPDIILIPELNIARQYELQIKKIANKLGTIIIGGLDYKEKNNLIRNSAIVCIPNRWPHDNGLTIGKSFLFGKKLPSRREDEYIKSKNGSWDPCNNFYLLDLGNYGKVGLAICADFYDIERYVIYKGRIQHLFILAFNQDIKSFYFLAESISRLVYCNVVICNTGYYGGSVCFSPAKEDYKRYIYKHEGQDIFTSQIVELPVESLWKAQCGDSDSMKKYKSPPPGYKYHYKENNTPKK